MSSSGDWTIILIDDEADIREVMTLMLQDAGYHVFSAPDGLAGLGLCDRVSPQIVMTDIRMPGMDGIQVLQTLKLRHPEVEVIVATAYGEMELAIRALQLDASDFITKPISDTSLFLALDRARQRFTSRRQIQDYTRLLEHENARTAQELSDAIAFQKNLIESSIDGILGCRADGLIVIFNRSAGLLLGYDRNRILNHLYLKDIFSLDEFERFQTSLAADTYGGKGRLYLYETALRSYNGEFLPVQISATVLMDQGADAGLVCFIRDLRELRQLEQKMSDQAQILHQDKMISLGRLAASVVHEINNPLAGVLNYMGLMRRILDKGTLSEERLNKFREFLELVESETRRCSRIVSGLLTFSRKSSASLEPVQIEELVNRCMLLSRHKLDLHHILVNVFMTSPLPVVQGDIGQLQQCLINLIFNAMDAMPDGGKLEIRADAVSSGHAVRVLVKDTGTGIATGDLPHIFEPFYTTKKEGYGVGLGLSTVYGIIEKHGGTVQVESEAGKGTTFILQLPVFQPVSDVKIP